MTKFQKKRKKDIVKSEVKILIPNLSLDVTESIEKGRKEKKGGTNIK